MDAPVRKVTARNHITRRDEEWRGFDFFPMREALRRCRHRRRHHRPRVIITVGAMV